MINFIMFKDFLFWLLFYDYFYDVERFFILIIVLYCICYYCIYMYMIFVV